MPAASEPSNWTGREIHHSRISRTVAKIGSSRPSHLVAWSRRSDGRDGQMVVIRMVEYLALLGSDSLNLTESTQTSASVECRTTINPLHSTGSERTHST